jgi:transcriptional regulator with XRE-family HTH domain
MNETAKKIKELRSRRGYSQEELAERSGLSLRTIQRIENGETEPRGDSLARLAVAFDVTVDELADWGLVEDNGFIVAMNLSALSFFFFPLLGIIVPLIIWMFKKDKIKGLNDVARELLNFQITWAIVFVLSLVIPMMVLRSPTFLFIVVYGYNLLSVIWNTIRITHGKKVVYRPAIPFIRK